jgi:hypothetical protein
MQYAAHSCSSAYKKDVQVPVCPLCNTPIPVRRGEPPDIAVGAHIDTDCQSDPAKNKRKVGYNLNLKILNKFNTQSLNDSFALNLKYYRYLSVIRTPPVFSITSVRLRFVRLG